MNGAANRAALAVFPVSSFYDLIGLLVGTDARDKFCLDLRVSVEGEELGRADGCGGGHD
jgi:hypothetical protein